MINSIQHLLNAESQPSQLKVWRSCLLFSFSAKSRRQPKPYKPKKMIKLETKTAVYTACNNGSSSIVTKDGELYMFGKDAIYSDSTCELTGTGLFQILNFREF